MARIAGVDLPRGKRIEVALTYIYGIGDTRARDIIEATGVDADQRTIRLGMLDLFGRAAAGKFYDHTVERSP